MNECLKSASPPPVVSPILSCLPFFCWFLIARASWIRWKRGGKNSTNSLPVANGGTEQQWTKQEQRLAKAEKGCFGSRSKHNDERRKSQKNNEKTIILSAKIHATKYTAKMQPDASFRDILVGFRRVRLYSDGSLYSRASIHTLS